MIVSNEGRNAMLDAWEAGKTWQQIQLMLARRGESVEEHHIRGAITRARYRRDPRAVRRTNAVYVGQQ